MPIKTKYLDNGLGIKYVGEEVVTGKDIISCNEKVFSSLETLKVCKYGLIDYSGISKLDVSTEEIRIIASQDKEAAKFVPDAVVAIVAKQDLEFGLSRMWETIVEISEIYWEIKVFRDKEVAKEWIRTQVKEKHSLDVELK